MQFTVKQLKEIKSVIETLERKCFQINIENQLNDDKIVEFEISKSGTYRIIVKDILD